MIGRSVLLINLLAKRYPCSRCFLPLVPLFSEAELRDLTSSFTLGLTLSQQVPNKYMASIANPSTLK